MGKKNKRSSFSSSLSESRKIVTDVVNFNSYCIHIKFDKLEC